MLKIIAIVAMVIDHIGLVFFPDLIILRIVGRLSFPIFAWGIANGYSRTRDVKKYSQRLLFLAFISQPFFYLVIDKEVLNICFSLFLGLMAICLYENCLKNKYLSYFLLILVFLIPFFVSIDYGLYGIIMILFFHVFKNNIFFIPAQSVLTVVRVLFLPTSVLQIFAIPSFFIIYYFKHLDFKINRYLQYSFYPAHLFIIYLITLFL